MRVEKLLRKIGPFVALAAAAGLSACDGVNITFDGEEGVPLEELDMSGDPPSDVVLAAPDTVVITAGDDFTIDVEGSAEATERMRFVLKGDMLAVHRAEGNWDDDERATVNITMPAPDSLVMAGSGTMSSNAMGARADITIAGSGTLTVSGLEAERMDLTIAGSGTVNASGNVDRLDLTVAGSGSANMNDLQVGDADVTIAGSGDAAFASDGRVEASIVGSGTVRVAGSATCSADTFGSGSLICNDAEVSEEAVEEDA